jgi:hypothetical protein
MRSIRFFWTVRIATTEEKDFGFFVLRAVVYVA